MSHPIESSKLLRLFNTGVVVIFIWKNETGWPVEYVSDSVKQVLGYQPQDFYHGSTAFMNIVHPHDSERVRNEVLFYSNQKQRTHFVHKDYRLAKADGSYLWVHDSTTLDRNSKGEVLRYIGYILDISERKASEQELEESQSRMELVLEGTRLGIWDWNPQTNEVAFNRRWAEMLGHDLSEIPFELESWRSRVHPEDLEQCYKDLQDHLEGRRDFYENVHRMKHKSGHWVYILDRGKIVARDKNGLPIRFTGTHTDISREKLAEKEARDASESKSLFLAKMSHEIRTPLNGILGMNELMLDSHLTKDQLIYANAIKESGELLKVIIDDILDHSKIEAGKLELDIHPFDLHLLAKNTYSSFQNRASQKGLTLKLAIEKSLPRFVESDSFRIKQIISNLLSNAIKFSQEGGITVHFKSMLKTGRVYTILVLVEDTGIGIKNASNIWEQFTQEDTSISRKFGGTGLGLSISRSLAVLLGGNIELTKTEPGKGSTFCFSFPITTKERAVNKDSKPESLMAPNARVMVAEDNHINQLVIRRMLEKMGIQPVIANNGKEALEAVLLQDFDLIFLDLHMPEMDGLEVALHINNHISTEKRPLLVALTADVIKETKSACMEAGMDGFLSKPFSKHDITKYVLKAGILRATRDGKTRHPE